MKLLVIGLTSLSVSALNIADPRWQQFKSKYAKKYTSDDHEATRYVSFLEALKKIEAHNAAQEKSRHFRMGVNKFSDIPYEEFRNTYLMTNVGNGDAGSEFISETRFAKDDPGPNEPADLPYPEVSEFECPEEFTKSVDIADEFKDTLDWRDPMLNPVGKATVTAIKDQKQCGSCYAFSAVSSMESSLCTTGKIDDCSTWDGLSEQQIINCGSYTEAGLPIQEDTDLDGPGPTHSVELNNQTYTFYLPYAEDKTWFNFNGCKGGWQSNVFQHIYQEGGIVSETTLGYTDYDGGKGLNNIYPNYFNKDTCAYKRENQYTYMHTYAKAYIGKKICGTTSKYANKDVDNIKQALFEKGPLAMCFYVEEDFQLMGSDPDSVYVPTGNSCQGKTINHAMNVVGYGTNSKNVDYWIIRNSWGSGWADGGYVKILRGENVCNSEAKVTYADMGNDYDILIPQDYTDPTDDNDSASVVVLSMFSVVLAALL